MFISSTLYSTCRIMSTLISAFATFCCLFMVLYPKSRCNGGALYG
nr:MAG TPA: hypothetical protein [Caudoviricetes sp.]